MIRIKRLLAVVLAAVMFVGCFAVTASAKSIFDEAVKITPGEMVSSTFKNSTENYYKIVLPDAGKITFYCSDYHSYVYLTLMDKNGTMIIKRYNLWGRINEQYEIPKKGTYYIKLEKGSENADHYKNFYYGFTPNETPTISIVLNVKVGGKLDLSSATTNYSGKVTWKSTEERVASVNNGIVSGLKAGTAKIRAYMDDGTYAQVTVRVKK